MDINTLTSRALEHPGIVPDMEVMLCLSISKNSKWVAACGTEVGHAASWLRQNAFTRYSYASFL